MRTRSKPRLLDLFCGAGGAAMGYSRAGFEVVGVDIAPQPHYPFEFHQADALAFLLRDMHFDAIHASPPCQHYSSATAWRGDRDKHPDLIDPVRKLLKAVGLPWVLENVEAAPLTGVVLCGSQFNLKVRRHRGFETSWTFDMGLRPACQHNGLKAFEHKQERAYADAMGCTWMNTTEARAAIPPAYTEFIGAQLLDQSFCSRRKKVDGVPASPASDSSSS
jgi:DNA (cytosine-5)-methyltransferase 1